ncbi:MAG TPA: glycosyltransferase family 39 protein, partial [Planctomycetota bacterium]|nr:glycosyltransferase family 39 protein [Planctomycetota bacterium]
SPQSNLAADLQSSCCVEPSPPSMMAGAMATATKFCAWAALGVVGQAALLGITRAGPTVTYHHVRIPPEPSFAWKLCAAFVAVQVAVVTCALFRGPGSRFARWWAWLRKHLAPWQMLLLVAVLCFSRAKIARPPEAWALELAFSSFLTLVALATWVLAAEALPDAATARLDAFVKRWLGPADPSPDPGGPDRFAWIAALAATVVTALLAFFVYERFPHVPDEVPYLIHAEYFAAGKLALAAPPVPQAFDVDLMFLQGARWFSPVPPGWPMALAIGAFVGAAWLVNPLLSGLTLLVAYAFVREIASKRTARFCVVLLALSPWFLFLGMSFMPHTWTNLCALTAALGVARARRTKPLAWCALAGLALGFVSLIRPLDGLVVAGLLGLWALGLGGRRLATSAIATLVLVTAAVSALVLPYNAALTGNPRHFPIMAYVDQVYGPGKNDLGFGPDKGLDWGGLDPWPGHDLFQAAVNSQFNLFALDAELSGWSIGAALWIALALSWSPRARRVRLAAAAIGAIVAVSCVYWFSGGPDFGARYWYLSIVPCFLLVSEAFDALSARSGSAAPRVTIVLALACAASALTFLPWRALDKYYHYRGMQPGIRELDATHHFGRSLVLVRGERHPDFASAAVSNPLDWEADAPVYAWDRGLAVRSALLAHYADRPVWIVAGPTRTGRGFEIVAGPLRADEVEAVSAR